MDCRTSFNGDNRYAYLAGTSMSTPQVAAAAALVRHLNPDLTIGQILTILKQSARRPAGGGWTPELGWGILNAGAALDVARRVDVRAPTSRLRAPRRSRRAVVRLRWSGSDPAPPGLVPSGIARFQIYAVTGGRTRRIASTRRKTSGSAPVPAGGIASTRSRSTPRATASCAPTARARASCARGVRSAS